MLPTLKTERLVLRPPRTTDLFAFNFYARKQTIGPRAGWPPHQSLEETKMILNLFIQEENNWSITIKPHDVMVGSLGLHNHSYDIVDGYGVHIGFALDDTYWNQGYITEATKKVVEYVFNGLKYDYIMIGHEEHNLASKKVIMKCGFIYHHDEIKDDYTGKKKIKVLYYRLDKKEYQAHE